LLDSFINNNLIRTVLSQKIRQFDIKLWIIGKNFIRIFPSDPFVNSQHELINLRDNWRDISNQDWFRWPYDSNDWMFINEIGEHPSYLSKNLIWHFRADLSGNHFFILYDDDSTLPWFDLSLIVNVLSLKNGGIPIHSGAVQFGENLFLFCGPSGAGKSTVCSMCERFGGKILDQDQVYLKKNFDSSFSADAWGYSLNKCDAKISGVINLIKDSDPCLIRRSQTYTAKLLLQRVLDLFGNKVPANITQTIFSFVSDISRTIPGYDLHFRKDQEFWNLIEEEFQL